MLKTKDSLPNLMNKDIIERLKAHGYTEVEGKSLRELTIILATLDIKAENPESSWF